MRQIVLLSLLVLVFIVILHTTKGELDTEENDLLFNILFRKGKNKKKPNEKGKKQSPQKTKTTKSKTSTKSQKTTKRKPNTKTKKTSKTKSRTTKTNPKTKTKQTTKSTKSTKKTTTTKKKPGPKITHIRYNFSAMFPPLKNYQVQAIPVSESKYPWIARVIHSRSRESPYMCTAICVDEAIFITAARCILTLKVAYTSVKYKGSKLFAIAFVTPSNPTRQYYEDIGIIVVDSKGYNKKWDTIEMELFGVKRKDAKFQWFSDLNLSKETDKNKFKVVGYAAEKYFHKIKTPDRPDYILSELDVKVSRKLCEKILYKHNVQGFDVTCYMSCTLEEYMENLNQSALQIEKNPSCLKYHGVEGGAIININTNKLLGVATWADTKDVGRYKSKSEFPVGFAVPNSQSFIGDYACAKKIRDTPKHTGTYQKLCK